MRNNRISDPNLSEYGSKEHHRENQRYDRPPDPHLSPYIVHRHNMTKPMQYNKPVHMNEERYSTQHSHQLQPLTPYPIPHSYPVFHNGQLHVYSHPTEQPSQSTHMVRRDIQQNSITYENSENHISSSPKVPDLAHALLTKYAFSYLDLVKSTFRDDPKSYEEFLNIMRDFKNNRINTPGVISALKTLFQPCPDLLSSFEKFLISSERTEARLNLENLPIPSKVSQIPSCIQPNAQTRTSVDFEDKSSRKPSIYPLPSHSISEIQKSDFNAMPKPMNVLNSPQHHKIDQNNKILLPAVRAPVPETSIIEPKRIIANCSSDRSPNPSFDDSSPPQYALEYISKIKARFSKKPEVYQNFLDILGRYQKNQKDVAEGTPESKKLHEDVYQGVSKLFKNDTDLLVEFNQFLPDSSNENLKAQNQEDATKALRKRKLKPEPIEEPLPPFHNSNIDAKTYNICTETIPESESFRIQKILKADDFLEQLPSWFKENDKYSFSSKRDVLNRLTKELSSKAFNHFLRVISLFSQGLISKDEVLSILFQIFDHNKDLFRQVCQAISIKEETVNVIYSKRMPSRSDQFSSSFEKPDDFFMGQNLDLSELRRIGTSYWPYKTGYVPSKCSGRTKIANEVLNDDYASQPILSENSTYRENRKTLSMDILQKTEQERYELEMVIVTNRAALSFLKKFLSKFKEEMYDKMSIDLSITSKTPFSIQTCYKAIQRVYGENCSVILEGLKVSCADTLPLVISRLQEKEIEWCEEQQLRNSFWGMEVKRNSLKALDYVGSSFKTMDMKNLRIKYLVKEISAKYSLSLEQFYSYDFSDSSDLLKINLSTEKNCIGAIQLVCYSVKRFTGITKVEKNKIYAIIYFIYTWIFSYTSPIVALEDEEFNYDLACPQMNHSLHPINLFINTNLYIFFRLFQKLCTRLKKVDELISSNNDTKLLRNLAFYDDLKSQDNKFFSNSMNLRQTVEPLTNEDKYEQFQNMLYNLIEGAIDSDYFEVGCITLFGLESYPLFTIDKIINAIVRQLSTLVVDSSTISLLNDMQGLINKYNNLTANINNMDRVEFVKYWQTTFDDEPCYFARFEKENDTVWISFKYLDVVMKLSSESDEFVDEQWLDYISKYTNLNFDDSLEDKYLNSNFSHSIFLNRNLYSGKKHRSSQKLFLKSLQFGKIEEASKNYTQIYDSKKYVLDEKRAVISYKLESDMMLNSYKITYVKNTEDLLYFTGSFQNAVNYFQSKHHSQKISRFKHLWAEKLCHINSSVH